MTRFDWQAYEDGSMDAATRAQADAWLAGSDQARLELESLRTFKAALHDFGSAEQVPIDRLRSSLATVTRGGMQTRRRQAYFWVSAVAVAAIAFAFVLDRSIPRIDDPGGPVMASESTVTQPAAVQAWLATKTTMPVPVIQLAGLSNASIEGASSGKDWISWKVRYCGQEYTLWGRQDQHWFDRAHVVKGTPKMFYVDGEHVGWYCSAGMAYMVCGGSEEGRMLIAQNVCKETPSAVKSQTSPVKASL